MTVIAKRCLEMQRQIETARAEGRAVPDFSEELAQMETDLRSRGEWREPEQEHGLPCPWQGCRCTHIGCTRGFLTATRPGVTVSGNHSPAALFRCPTCNQARPMKGRESKWTPVAPSTGGTE